jgi:hypothetical protein
LRFDGFRFPQRCRAHGAADETVFNHHLSRRSLTKAEDTKTPRFDCRM